MGSAPVIVETTPFQFVISAPHMGRAEMMTEEFSEWLEKLKSSFMVIIGENHRCMLQDKDLVRNLTTQAGGGDFSNGSIWLFAERADAVMFELRWSDYVLPKED